MQDLRFAHPGTWNCGLDMREGESLPFGFQSPAREASAAFRSSVFHNLCETLAPQYARHRA